MPLEGNMWRERERERHNCLLEKTLFWRVNPPKIEVLHGLCFFHEILVDSRRIFLRMNI